MRMAGGREAGGEGERRVIGDVVPKRNEAAKDLCEKVEIGWKGEEITFNRPCHEEDEEKVKGSTQKGEPIEGDTHDLEE